MNTITTQDNLITELSSLITQGIECWSKAGEIVVRLIDEHNESIETIALRSKYLTEDIVARFEQLGRKQLMPELLIASYSAANKIARLPYSQQRSVMEDGVDVLLGNGDTMKIMPENLNPDQVRQVFDKNLVRNIAAQKAYMESVCHESQKKLQSDYSVKNGKIVINNPCTLTQKDLLRMINELA